MATIEITNKINKELKASSGFTITLKGNNHKHKKGYCVSLTNNKARNIKRALANLYKIPISIKGKRIYLGGWCDINTNTYYIDYTIILKNKSEALKIATLFNQLAIYDIENNKSIYLKGVNHE